MFRHGAELAEIIVEALHHAHGCITKARRAALADNWYEVKERLHEADTELVQITALFEGIHELTA